MAEVRIVETGRVAGVWVNCDKGCIGIIAEDGVGAYLAVYEGGNNLPTVAVSADGVQLADGRQPVRRIELESLLRLAE